MIPDQDKPSGNIVAKGIIERDDRNKLEQSPPSDMAKADALKRYAESDIWHDAIAAISDPIQSNQADGELLGQRASLLEPGGLGEVAARMLAMQASTALYWQWDGKLVDSVGNHSVANEHMQRK
jgi:hypothetical protein